MIEGEQSNSIYFIESGSFEVNKDIYLYKERSNSWYEYLRFSSTKSHKSLKHLLDPDTMILHSLNRHEKDAFYINLNQKKRNIK